MASLEGAKIIENFLAKSTGNTGEEPFEWNECSKKEITEAVTKGLFDVDYLCVKAKLNELFSCTEFERMLNAGTGTVFRKSMLYHVRNSTAKKVYLLFTLGLSHCKMF